MKGQRRYKAVLVLAFSLCFSICQAQYSLEGTINPVVTVNPVLNIEITGNASNPVSFTSTSNFSNGITVANFARVKIKSNQLWAFGVSSATPHFTASGNYSSPNMPSQVLGIRLSTQAPYQQLTTTPKILTTGGRGDTNAPGNTFNLALSANPGYDYGPGIYSITINYTLTAP